MFSPSQYGFNFGLTQFTSNSYYWNGIQNNFAKYPNAGSSVEAGYLSGLTSVPSLGSNLGTRKALRTYSDMGVGRFSSPSSTLVKFVGRFGLSRATWTVDTSGQFWPPITPSIG